MSAPQTTSSTHSSCSKENGKMLPISRFEIDSKTGNYFKICTRCREVARESKRRERKQKKEKKEEEERGDREKEEEEPEGDEAKIVIETERGIEVEREMGGVKKNTEWEEPAWLSYRGYEHGYGMIYGEEWDDPEVNNSGVQWFDDGKWGDDDFEGLEGNQ